MTNSYKIAGGIVSALLLVSLLTLSRCGTELNPSHVKTRVDNSINLTVFEYKNEVKATEAYYEFHNLKYDKYNRSHQIRSGWSDWSLTGNTCAAYY